ncbi:hypothetical protein N781_05430 [Pontibacillus halophilus JSM 076056 = DSM 19796]|uniref:Aminotransferase class V domain-containing protein n=1 Tax=Pontibacillus halophilus JSM 076056 = DSM 19796 TaxID=1385510 RepID=A0A0A5GJ56_9BACI|nr:aminotransferase class V-fold PLP-dependent enzyme [Pontibacillus halophilus]KGX91185.1 hypothetical protein N781_05430 [Pontibacillus halophilus JSM 076056 = DSM 19796]
MSEDLPILREGLYFNHAGAGPMLTCTGNEIAKACMKEQTATRANLRSRYYFQEELDVLRAEVAKLIHCSAHEIAITTNTTEGINIILNGMNLPPGSEILTLRGEHFGTKASMTSISERKQIRIISYSIHEDHLFDVEDIMTHITPNTKVILVSHIMYETGRIIPIRELVSLAKRLNIKVVVDGAQAVGSLNVDVKALGVDAYVFPAHKWLLGPEGIGFLYCSEAFAPSVSPTYANTSTYDWNDEGPSLVKGARKFETGTRYRPLIKGMIQGLKWIQARGIATIHDRTCMNMSLMKELVGEAGLPLLSNRIHNIASVILPSDLSSKSLRKELETEQIFLEDVPRYNAIRISVSFHHEKHEMEELVHAIYKNVYQGETYV